MNTTELLNDVKQSISVPDYQKRYDNEDLLRFAFNNLNSKILQLLLQVDEEYNVMSVEVSHLANAQFVDIPPYFVGQQVRAVMYRAQGDSYYYNLSRYELRERFVSSSLVGRVRGFSFQNDRLYFHPIPDSAGSVLFFYRRKHPKLVLPTAVGTVLSSTATTVTLTSTPPQSFVAGARLDFNKGRANYQAKVMDEPIASVSGNTLTMVNPVTPWGLQPGDEVSLHNETSLVQLPDEMHQPLIWSVCVDILRGLSLTDQAMIAEREYQERVMAALEILKPRSQDSLATIVQYNGVLSRPVRRFPSVSV